MQNDSHTDHLAVEMLWYMVLAIYILAAGSPLQ